MLKPNINQPFRPVCCSSSRVFCHRCTSLSHPLASPWPTFYSLHHHKPRRQPTSGAASSPPPHVPLCVWFKARTLYYIRFCVLYIMLYISPPFDLPRSPLLFALTEHKLVSRANADSGQFLWRHGIHAHFVTSVRYLDGIPLQLQDPLFAQFSLL